MHLIRLLWVAIALSTLHSSRNWWTLQLTRSSPLSLNMELKFISIQANMTFLSTTSEQSWLSRIWPGKWTSRQSFPVIRRKKLKDPPRCGKQGFQLPPNHTFYANGKVAGTWGYEVNFTPSVREWRLTKIQRGLSYHYFLKAGHEVPHDQPASVFAFVRDFVTGKAGYKAKRVAGQVKARTMPETRVWSAGMLSIISDGHFNFRLLAATDMNDESTFAESFRNYFPDRNMTGYTMFDFRCHKTYSSNFSYSGVDSLIFTRRFTLIHT